MSQYKVSIQVADPDEQGETRIGGTGKRFILISLFLLAKVDILDYWPFSPWLILSSY